MRWVAGGAWMQAMWHRSCSGGEKEAAHSERGATPAPRDKSEGSEKQFFTGTRLSVYSGNRIPEYKVNTSPLVGAV